MTEHASTLKVIHDLLPNDSHSRIFVYDLADGIVRLTSERQKLTTARQFEVLKMRGATYVTGRHFFEIGADGRRETRRPSGKKRRKR